MKIMRLSHKRSAANYVVDSENSFEMGEISKWEEEGPFTNVLLKGTGLWCCFVKQNDTKKYDPLYYGKGMKLNDKLWYAQDQNGTCDIYDNSGNLLHQRIGEIGTGESDRIMIRKAGNIIYGYIDFEGKLIVPCVYDYAKEFQPSGYAVVGKKIDGEMQMGVIDTAGKFTLALIPADGITTMSENECHYIVKRKGKVGVINAYGKFIINCFYDDIYPKGKFFCLRKDGKYGLASAEGKIIFECIYSELIETEDKFVVPEFLRKEVKKSEYEKR